MRRLLLALTFVVPSLAWAVRPPTTGGANSEISAGSSVVAGGCGSGSVLYVNAAGILGCASAVTTNGTGALTANGVITSSHTETETAAEIAGGATEHDGSRYDANFTGVGINVLWSGFRFETQYDISAATAIASEHGGTAFFETNSARNNKYFSFGIEDSIKAFVGSSAGATASPVCHISHVKIWNDQNITQNFPAMAWNPRMDFFNGSNESVAFSTHSFGWFIRPEAFRLNQQNTSNIFGWYSPTDKSIQNVNAGNVFKVSVSTVVDNGSTLDLSQACGGRLIMTSTASITLSASKFANTIGVVPPSSSTLSTPYLSDCQVKLVNGNLGTGFTITIKDTSDYTPMSAGDEVFRQNGGEIEVWALGSAGQWVESKAATSVPSVVDAFNASFGAVTAGSTSTLTWTEVIDRQNEFVTSSFTVVAPGLYEVGAQANASQTAGTGCLLIKLNGTSIAGGSVCATGATALATVLGITNNRILSLAAGDIVRVDASATSANVTFQNMTLTIRKQP